jgi:hypothetical protein
MGCFRLSRGGVRRLNWAWTVISAHLPLNDTVRSLPAAHRVGRRPASRHCARLDRRRRERLDCSSTHHWMLFNPAGPLPHPGEVGYMFASCPCLRQIGNPHCYNLLTHCLGSSFNLTTMSNGGLTNSGCRTRSALATLPQSELRMCAFPSSCARASLDWPAYQACPKKGSGCRAIPLAHAWQSRIRTRKAVKEARVECRRRL